RGDPLPTETQMCSDLNVSRSSVREAVRTLSALDIVEVRHGRGMFVGSVSMRPMVELLAFRGLLNPGDDWRALKDIVQVRQALDLALAQPVIDAWQDKPSALME
ncbi:FadR/GntR family transcriptional regulator, partial [Mycobacterium tuberculosis]